MQELTRVRLLEVSVVAVVAAMPDALGHGTHAHAAQVKRARAVRTIAH